MNPRVKNVKPISGVLLQLTFDDGSVGTFSVAPYLTYPVFQPLKDPEVFKTARAAMGFVSWKNGEIDIDPDTLYLESVFAEAPVQD